jgi:asparagine synthase (glutamine-hydrolysing)
MCGIAGIALTRAQGGLSALGAEMMRRLEHRGPDDHGWLCWGHDGVCVGQAQPHDGLTQVMLLHRRLSILDLTAAGRQPMSTSDGRYHLVFNGEIYNYLELRAELEAAGRVFHTRTDTEVLLAALAAWGTGALVRLVGMFAFALLDTQERTLLLARDFFGIKPLYYVRDAQQLTFASEIKALLPLPGLRRRVRPAQLYQYLLSGLTDDGADTLLEGIQQLLPGHYLHVAVDRPGAAEPRAYWTLRPDERADLSFNEAARQLRELFLESVRMHLRSDVAVGSALSGGIDSSAIVAAVRTIGGRQLECHTFSFIAAQSTVSEERWSDMASAAAGTIAHKLQVDPQELRADVDRLIQTQDEPFGSTSLYAQYRVFRSAREAGIKVLLDGQGGDELLAGYTGYLYPRAVELLRAGRLWSAARFARRAAARPGVRWHRLLARAGIQFAPAWLRKPVEHWMSPAGTYSTLNAAWFAERGVAVCSGHRSVSCDGLRSALIDAVHRSALPRLLRHEDRNSMAFGVESRVPFLTPALAQFTLSLPPAYLLAPDGTSKSVFRAAMRGLVPDAILDRKQKLGFETPEFAWLQALRPWVTEILSGATARALPALRHERVVAHAEAVLSGRRAFDWRVWRWLNLIRWSELYQVEYA